MGIEEIRPMADEVAGLMASRFGGVKRGQQPDLDSMMRKRGGALPRRLRRAGLALAQADLVSGHPKLARQMDLGKLQQAHRALTGHLRPLQATRAGGGGAVGLVARVVFGLLILGAIALWIMTGRGLL